MLFDLPPTLSPAMRLALAKPRCVEVLAMAILVREASRIMRGDGTAAGPAVVVDSVPAFFNVGLDHRARKAFQSLAGFDEHGTAQALWGEMIDGVSIPSHARLADELMNRKRAFAHALRAAADAVEDFVWTPK